MSNFVAVIKSLVGQVFVVSLDGLKRQVFEGERLFQGDQVVTASGGAATLQLAAGDVIDVGANGNWQASAAQAAEPAQTAQAPASELEQAIAAGFDPTADLEPTAAGPGAAGGAGGAAGGGHSFVMLDETAQQLDPTVGFETEGLGLAAATPVEEQAPEFVEALEIADTTPPVVSISIDPITDDNILNAQELLGDMLTITGTVGGDAKLGDTITLNVGGSLYNGTVIQRPDGSLGFEIGVGTGDLREASSITATISSTDAAGNTGTATIERGYDVDTTANLTVSLDDVNSSNVANAPISGTSDVGEGRTVTLVITDANGDTVTTDAVTAADGSYNTNADLSSLADGNLIVTASVTDAAGNTANASDDTTLLDTSAEASISLDAIAGDDILNANELGGDIVQITGSVGGDAKAGDTVTLTLGSATYSGPVIELADGTLGFAINVGTGDLRDNTQINASVTATDSNSNTVTAEADRGYSVDTSAEASISLDFIAGDDILNAAEAAADVAVSGSVGGDAQAGDTVTLTIGSETYSGAVLAGNTFSINVPGSVLAANSSVNASVTATDSNGNTVTAEADRGYSVDTSAEASISLDAIAGDDILNAAEAAADVAVSGSVGGDAQAGDTVTLTIGSETYTGEVLAGNTFSINVPGSVLAANSSVNASVTATDSNGNTVTAEADRGYSVDLNIAPTGTDGVIALDEDSVHHFSADDFGFTDANLGDTLQAVRIDSLPTAGSLQFNGTAVSAGQVIALADLNNLTFTPAHDASGDNYSTLTFSVSDQAGQFALAPSTLSFDVTPVADAPIVTIELGAASISTTTITTANVTSGQGFSVSAINLDGTTGVISTNGSPVGFGVEGDASGANNELGQFDGQSERIVVEFDAPVASATVSFAWLHTGERATYELFDSAGNPIGSGTIAGLTDVVDPAITLTSSAGAAISRIEFSAPSGGDNDYLINSIEFVSSIGYPLTITATPTDIDYSESIASITVAVPAGATLSVGTQNIDGTWTLPLSNVAGNDGYSVVIHETTKAVTITGLEMTVPGNPVGDLSVTVTATAQDGTDTESTATTITIGDTGAPETNDVAVVADEDSGPVAIILSATDDASSIANFTITSLPANGTLIYNGQEVLIGQAIPAIDNQASLSFTPNANWNGSTDFQYLASDVAGNVDLTPASVSILINAVNNAPVNHLPAGYTTYEDVALKLSGLSVSDVDVASGLISVTLAVARGTITAADAGAVTVTGSGSGSLVLSGTLADINAYLADTATQPTYLPVADDSGSVTLTMTSNDGGNTGAGGPLTDSDSITISINPVADAVPGSDVSLVIGAPLTNEISFVTDGGLTGKGEHTFGNGVTISTGGNGTFNWSGGNNLGVNSAGDNGTEAQRIEGDEAIHFSFPTGMQYMALKLKNSADDVVKVSSKLEAADLQGQTALSGSIATSSTSTVSSANLQVELQLEVLNAGITSTVTRIATVNSGGNWSVSLTGISGTITKATLNATLDGALFNQGGNDSANVTYSVSADMSSLSIGLGAADAFSGKPKANNGFQIEYIAVDPNPSGLTSYSYPVDLFAAVQDTVGTAETFTSLILSDLPAGATLSVVGTDGSYQEITPNAQGEYDLSAYTALLNTPTTTSGTDKLYLVTETALPSGFAPTLTLEVSDGPSSTAKTIIGGSADSTLTGGAGNDYISGGAGQDSLNGGAGDDTLDGGTGNDILIGGAGDDILLGGTGADTFVWQAGDIGNDVITDFNIGEGDRIDLSDLLQGETDATIDNYLQLVTNGSTSTLLISTEGHLNDGGGTPAANADTSIELTGVNLSSSSINSLIAGADPVIKIDHA